MPALMVSPSVPSFLASTQKVIVPAGIWACLMCVALGGSIDETETRLHWCMRALTSAWSKAFSLLVLLSPLPEVTKNFLKFSVFC